MIFDDLIRETEMQDQFEEICNEVNSNQKFHIWTGVVNGGKSQFFKSCNESNPDLIGFNNGVYDLRTGEFSDRYQEDCAFTTGNDFREFEQDDELIVAVYQFMAQLFPDPDVCDYVLTLFA